MMDVQTVAKQLGYGDVDCHFDPQTGLVSIIAIHSTKRGPAIGGCRYQHYNSFNDAMIDALRLGQAMSLKAALHELPHGGAKTVLIKPEQANKPQLLRAYANHLNRLQGRYITAVDMGTSDDDMEYLANYTPYVLASQHCQRPSHPSPCTARGVFLAMQAAVMHKLGTDRMDSLHVAIQGLGHVGLVLCQMLHERNVTLSVCDTNLDQCAMAAHNFGAQVVEPDAIYEIQCDIFAPCAKGGVLNDRTIRALNASMVIGAANNPCLDPIKHPQMLFDRDILYVPDYLANGGGLIHASDLFNRQPASETDRKLQAIYTNTLAILEEAKAQQKAPICITDQLAHARMNDAKPKMVSEALGA